MSLCRLIVAVLAILCSLAQPTFAQDAAKLLQKQMDEYHARGEPGWITDLQPPPVPDADNAALDLIAAAAVMKADIGAWNQFDLDVEYRLPFAPAQLTQAGQILERYRAVFPLIASAKKKSGVDWQKKIASPLMNVLLPHLSETRMLSNLLKTDAIQAFQSGNHHQALERAQDMLFISRAAGHQPFLVGALVAIAEHRSAMSLLAQGVTELSIDPNPLAASPEQIRLLIRDLLDERPASEEFVRAIQSERVFQADMATAIVLGTLDPNLVEMMKTTGGFDVKASAANPEQLFTDTLADVRLTTACTQAVTEPTWPACSQKLPEVPVVGQPKTLFTTDFSAAFIRYYQFIAERRLVAAALAVRWYAAEHAGQLPANLEALVPAYLPAVPADPFALAAQPIHYRNDPANPIVYSVGINGADDGGSEKNLADNDIWKAEDAVVHLKRP
jgi:hypothetical protein